MNRSRVRGKGVDAMRNPEPGARGSEIYVNPSRDPRLSHKEQMAMRRMIKNNSRKTETESTLSAKELSWIEKERRLNNGG